LRRRSERLLVGRLYIHGQAGTVKPLAGGAERDGSRTRKLMQAVLNGLLQSDLVGVRIGRHGKASAIRPASPTERTGDRPARPDRHLVGLHAWHAGEYRFNLPGRMVGLLLAGARRQG